jgi:hypothetical protein
MGYSYSAKAGYTMDAIGELVDSKISNGLPGGGFFEYGCENADGAITGAVWVPYMDTNKVTKAGSFKINPDGTIARFPRLAKKIRDEAVKRGAEKYERIHVVREDWSVRAKAISEFLKTEDGKGMAKYVWDEVEGISRSYQMEKNVSFLVMPDVETGSMIEFLEGIAA